MSKRRDNKGRILRSGEIQRSNGRYVYQYTDFTGKRRSVYSSRLEKIDSYPEGSLKWEPSLREKEKAIKDKLESGICDFDTNITVLELAERYIATKTGVKESTKAGYRTTLNIIRNGPFGHKKIGQVKLSDAKLWLKDGRRYSLSTMCAALFVWHFRWR